MPCLAWGMIFNGKQQVPGIQKNRCLFEKYETNNADTQGHFKVLLSHNAHKRLMTPSKETERERLCCPENFLPRPVALKMSVCQIKIMSNSF